MYLQDMEWQVVREECWKAFCTMGWNALSPRCTVVYNRPPACHSSPCSSAPMAAVTGEGDGGGLGIERQPFSCSSWEGQFVVPLEADPRRKWTQNTGLFHGPTTHGARLAEAGAGQRATVSPEPLASMLTRSLPTVKPPASPQGMSQVRSL